MKKTISVVVALAMVLVMTFSAFAAVTMTTPKPTDPKDADGWTAYYTELFGYAETDAEEVVDTMLATLGEVDQEIAPQVIVSALLAADMTAEGRQQLIDAIRKAAEEQGIELPPLPGETPTLPELPSDFEPSFTLPDFGGSGNGSFLDTILGALGGLGDILFGGGNNTEDPTTPDDDDDDDLWGDDDDMDDPEIPDMGDTSVVAVGAVAAVAVAALVLTRKKSKDDDAE